MIVFNKKLITEHNQVKQAWNQLLMQRESFNINQGTIAAQYGGALEVNQAALISKDYWREVDNITTRVFRNDEGNGLLDDLLGLGTPISIGKTAALYRVSSDAGKVHRLLTGHVPEELDKVIYDEAGDPIPIFNTGYGREWNGMQSENLDAMADDQEAHVAAMGEYYRWDGALPKYVDAGSTPATSGGTGVGAWVGVGDASLRSSLAAEGGAALVTNSAIAIRDMGILTTAPWVKAGQLYDLQSFVSLENGGRGYWLAVNTSTVTPNGIDIIQSTSKPSVSFVFQPVNGTVDIRQLGAIGGADVTAILNRAYQMISANTRILTAKSIGETFLCSDKIVAGKTTLGINKPVFDFNSCSAGVDAWSYENELSPLTT